MSGLARTSFDMWHVCHSFGFNVRCHPVHEEFRLSQMLWTIMTMEGQVFLILWNIPTKSEISTLQKSRFHKNNFCSPSSELMENYIKMRSLITNADIDMPEWDNFIKNRSHQREHNQKLFENFLK